MAFKRIVLAAGLGIWYLFTSPSSETLRSKHPYTLPQEIVIEETSLNYETRSTEMGLEKIVDTSEIDFSEEFFIKTEDYTLVKEEEGWLSKSIGFFGSLPFKLYFWDWDAGKGLDSEKTRAVLSMLESEKGAKNLTVRVNHNRVFYDLKRLFNDEKVKERNGLVSRIFIGAPTIVFGEMFAEFTRGDYYNPMTQTTVLFSNIESVSAHELGHHKDHQRFKKDWPYSFAAALPPVKLYKEWKASAIARDNLLESQDDWQFKRYLIPAFISYVAAFVGLFSGKKKDDDKKNDGFKIYVGSQRKKRPY